MMHVVITGAGRGIGYELTSRYLEKGYQVSATYRSDQAKKRLQSLDSKNGKLSVYPLDVRDDAMVADFVGALQNERIDILINNAGIMGSKRQTRDDMDYQGWLDLFEVNTIAPFRITTALLPNLERSSAPRVITLSSMMGQLSRKSKGFYGYRSSKTAVNKVMQILSVELEEKNIIVCPVHPGWVQTEMGGDEAEITVAESAAGLIKVIDTLTMSKSGRFWQWNGQEMAW